MKTTTVKSFFIVAIALFFMTFTAQAQRSAPAGETAAILEAFEATNNTRRALAAVSQAEWADYSERLSQTLVSDQAGLQQSALQRIIRYGAYLPAEKATVFEVMKIYRNHDDDRMRRMAVIALGELEDAWAMGFLKRAVKFEQNEQVAHTIKYVMKNYDGSYQ